MTETEASTLLPHLNGFLSYIETYLPKNDIKRVRKALNVAAAAHKNAFRLNGEPYLAHPLAVARYLAEWYAPADVLIAGLLHDVAKPKYAAPLEIEEIGKLFGEQIANLVRDITLLGRLGYVYPGESKAVVAEPENDISQRLPWAANIMYRSPTAVIIKLADRLHNFHSLEVLPEERRLTYATVTRNIFSPFAERLGMRIVKRQLDDFAFQRLQPKEYETAVAAANTAHTEQKIAPLLSKLHQELTKAGIQAKLSLKKRSMFDLYNLKMKKGRHYNTHLAHSIIVTVPNEMACYQALGVIHKNWQPLPGKLRDMIALPRVNGYRAIHTSVRTEQVDGVRIAIRDPLMDLVADYGLAAEWQGVPKRYLPEFPEWKEPPPGEIAVLTPDGDVKMLPQGATAVDFAYAIHDQLGNQCTGAVINGSMMPLDYPLQSGDHVDILTSRASVGPLPEWLNFVQTSKARIAIRRWLREREPTKAAETGWQILDSTLRQEGTILSSVDAQSRLQKAALDLGYESWQKMLTEIGLGQSSPKKVVRYIQKRAAAEMDEWSLRPVVLFMADPNLKQKLAKCCTPLPPDHIVGYVTKKNIATIHRSDCPRVKHLHPLINADWMARSDPIRLEIEITALDRPGLVRDISSIPAEQGVGMLSFHADRLVDGSAKIRFGLGRAAPENVIWIIDKLRQLDGVRQVKQQQPSNPAKLMEEATLVQQFHNPYTLGPVKGDGFVGRDEELRMLVNNLRNLHPGEAVLLWGPRRIGKTSLLLQFQQYVMNNEDYILAYVDMQRLSGRPTTMFLRDIIRAIIEAVPDAHIPQPKYSRLKRDPLSYFRGFLEQQPALQGKILVLILDEFQLLSSLVPEGVTLEDINRYFRSQIQHRQGMCIIFSGGGIVDYLLDQPDTSFMLEAARQQWIGTLSPGDARRLVLQAQRRVAYEDTAVQQLVDVTAGHPYLLQWLCGELVDRADREQRDLITLQHLQDVLTDWVPYQTHQYFSYLWGTGIGMDLRLVHWFRLILTAVSEFNIHRPDSSRWVSVDDIGVLGENGRTLYNIIGQDRLLAVMDDLVKMHTLQKEQGKYRIRVPLCEQWLQKNYTITQLIKEKQW
jgi:GTP pyrophosphokinase